MSIPPVKAVIFDFNGTLFFDGDKHVQAWSEISEKLRHRPMDQAELNASCNGLPNHMIVRYLTDNTSSAQLERKISRQKEARYRELCLADPGNLHLVPGAIEMFEALQARKIPFTIASASIKENIDFYVETFQLDRWIDPSTILYDDGSNPDKEAMFRQACISFGQDPQDVMVFEDSISGVKSAVKAGIGDIRIINGARTPQVFEAMDAVSQVADDFFGFDFLADEQ